MKSNVRWLMGLAIIAGSYWGITTSALADPYAEQLKAAAAARAKDPTWKPATVEIGKIQIGNSKTPGALKNFCLNADGNILACFVPQGATAKTGRGIRVYSPKGELLNTMPLEIDPAVIGMAKDGSIFVAGEGQLVKLDANGKVLATAASPVSKVPVVITKEIEEMLKQSGRPVKEQLESMKATLERRRGEVTGLAITGQDVFITVPTPNEFTFQVYRFDQTLTNPKLVVEKLRGCCGQMDLQAHDGKIWIPH
ncbi:MAG: SMP-30/Gluconolaconase/LRE-like region, partial [Verrucomicrobia bacterium]|nr:SMP-30/Gluconolaconase/LRE-like region [Verrucomicrobiota bacterium]